MDMKSHDSRHDADGSQRFDVSRRKFLATSAVGIAGLGAVGSAAAASNEHTLVISGTGTKSNYSFTVGGNLEKSTADGATIDGDATIIGNSAHGLVGSGKDAYTFTGPLYSFDFVRSNPIDVELDGEAAHVGRRPDHTLVIEGTGPSTSYSFTVGGNLEKSTADGASISSSDEIVENSAHGGVGSGKDAYTFNGPLHSFDFDRSNAINVELDGEAARVGQRPDHTLVIEGFGEYTEYSFATDSRPLASEAYGATINPDNYIGSFGASGAVENEKNAYKYDGELHAFYLDGEARVTIDGKAAHVGQRPEFALRVFLKSRDLSTDYTVRINNGSFREKLHDDQRGHQTKEISGNVVHDSIWGASGDMFTFDGNFESIDADDINALEVYCNHYQYR